MKLFRRLRSFLRKPEGYIPAILFSVILFILLTNSVHENYPDEFDNILGGWRILHGTFLYSGFFTHHNPIPYLLAAIIEIFSGRSFVRFRFVYTLVMFGYFIYTYYFFQKRFSFDLSKVYLAFLGALSVTTVYFWGHMLLADNLAAFFLGPVFLLLLLRSINKQPLIRSDLIFISVLSFLALFSSLTYIYLICILYAYTFYYYLRTSYVSWRKSLVPFGIVFAVPYVVLGALLLLTGSFSDYIFHAFIFNGKYYVYNYPGHQEGVGMINPLRYMIVISHTFFNNFSILLIQVPSLNFSFPYNITLALGNLAMMIYLIFRRRYMVAAFLYLFLMFANVRSDPLSSGEKDYQSAVYMVVSILNVCFSLYLLWHEIKQRGEMRKVISAAIVLVLGVYAFFASAFLLRSYGDKIYNKYMGMAALIYDRPKIAPIINAITDKDDYVWIGPFEFEELFYTNGKIPSKYQILLPGFRTADQIKNEILSDFEKNPPKVMYFDKRFSILGRRPEDYAEFFVNFVKQNYITLQQINESEEGVQYKSTFGYTERPDLEGKLFIRKDSRNEVIQRLIQSGYVKQQ